MAIDFPSAPALDQEYTDTNGTVWICTSATGPIWARKSTLAVSGDTVSYNNTGSSLSATDVNSAIDELDSNKANLASPTFTGNPTAPTPSAGDNDTSIATTEFVQDEIVSHAHIGKNLLINGDFSVWQRGESFASINNTFTADRWYYNTPYGQTSNVERIGYNGLDGVINALKWTNIGTGGGNNPTMTTRLEDVKRFSGKTFTLSFKIKSDSITTYYINVIQKLDNGGTGDVTHTDSIETASGWLDYEQTITFDDTSGSTVGSNSYLEINIYHNGAVSKVSEIANVQLELGSQATDFEVVDPATQLARCQRYYERWIKSSVDNFAICNGAFASSTTFTAVIGFTRKRIPPNFDTSTVSTFAVQSGGAFYGVSAISYQMVNENTLRIDATVTGATNGYGGTLINTNPGAWIEFDSEIY